jgi:hypothetical protein
MSHTTTLSFTDISRDEVIPLIHESQFTVARVQNDNIGLMGQEITCESNLKLLSSASMTTNYVDEDECNDHDILGPMTTDNVNQNECDNQNSSTTFEYLSPKPEMQESSMRINIDANVSDSSEAFFTPVKLTSENPLALEAVKQQAPSPADDNATVNHSRSHYSRSSSQHRKAHQQASDDISACAAVDEHASLIGLKCLQQQVPNHSSTSAPSSVDAWHSIVMSHLPPSDGLRRHRHSSAVRAETIAPVNTSCRPTTCQLSSRDRRHSVWRTAPQNNKQSSIQVTRKTTVTLRARDRLPPSSQNVVHHRQRQTRPGYHGTETAVETENSIALMQPYNSATDASMSDMDDSDFLQYVNNAKQNRSDVISRRTATQSHSRPSGDDPRCNRRLNGHRQISQEASEARRIKIPPSSSRLVQHQIVAAACKPRISSTINGTSASFSTGSLSQRPIQNQPRDRHRSAKSDKLSTGSCSVSGVTVRTDGKKPVNVSNDAARFQERARSTERPVTREPGKRKQQRRLIVKSQPNTVLRQHEEKSVQDESASTGFIEIKQVPRQPVGRKSPASFIAARDVILRNKVADTGKRSASFANDVLQQTEIYRQKTEIPLYYKCVIRKKTLSPASKMMIGRTFGPPLTDLPPQVAVEPEVPLESPCTVVIASGSDPSTPDVFDKSSSPSQLPLPPQSNESQSKEVVRRQASSLPSAINSFFSYLPFRAFHRDTSTQPQPATDTSPADVNHLDDQQRQQCESSEQTNLSTDGQNNATSTDENTGKMQSVTANEEGHFDDVVIKQQTNLFKVGRVLQQHEQQRARRELAGQRSKDLKIKVVERPAWKRF